MKAKFSRHMRELWDLTGYIGTLAEKNNKYGAVYMKLSDALDQAEAAGLIEYEGCLDCDNCQCKEEEE